jgi:hypothetical protein
MMVATALVLFVMVILTQAFSAGLEVFRQLKGIGDMEQRLRSTATIIRRDLVADHFEGKRRISDPNFWVTGPPREGFLHIHGSAPTVLGPAVFDEHADADGIPSLRATDHVLHLTVKLRGNNRGDFFTTQVPAGSPLLTLGQPDARFQDAGNTYNSQWAEVLYYLWSSGTKAGSTPLYSLMCRRCLGVSKNDDLNWGTKAFMPLSTTLLTSYTGISCQANPSAGQGGNIYFNNQTDLTVPDRRLAFATPPSPLGTGEEILLTDVVSFSVQILNTSIASDFIPSSTVANYGSASATLPSGATYFDTWSSVNDGVAYTTYTAGSNPPNPITISAIQITIRVWDVRTQQTRQITIVQDM